MQGRHHPEPAAVREAGGGSSPACSNQGLCSQSGLRGKVVLSKGKPSRAAAASSHAGLSRDHVAIHVPGQGGAPGCHLHSRRCGWWLSFSISSSSVGSSRTSLWRQGEDAQGALEGEALDTSRRTTSRPKDTPGHPVQGPPGSPDSCRREQGRDWGHRDADPPRGHPHAALRSPDTCVPVQRHATWLVLSEGIWPPTAGSLWDNLHLPEPQGTREERKARFPQATCLHP